MALIKCPECEREISDKAVSCPHCGMPIRAVTTDSEPKANNHTKKKGAHKYAIVATVAVALIAFFVAISSGSLGAEGKIALRDCETLQEMCKVPSSFEVYEAIVYHDENYGACTYITYGAENSYGAKLKSVAIFADGRYLGDYGDEKDDFNSLDEYDRFLLAHMQYKLYLISGSDKEYAAKCEMKFVAPDKLMKKLDGKY